MGNQIATAIQKMAHPIFKDDYGIVCTVNSIDLTLLTCVCSPINGETDIPGVRLQAQKDNGIVVIPVIGSKVVVQPLNEITGYVALFSQVDSIAYFDGSFGGWVKATILTTKLNNLENLVNDLISKFNAHVHTGVQTGAGSSGPTATPETTTLTPTTQADIQSTKITHGQ